MATPAQELAQTDKPFPPIGLGTFIGIEGDDALPAQERQQVIIDTVLSALKMGYRHIDLAENYGNLASIGKALRIAFADSSAGGLGIKRDELWLTMKSDNYSLEAINDYIELLGVDYLDTFMLHHPYGYAFKSESTLLNTWRDVTSLPKALVKTYGVSNCYTNHLLRLQAVCKKNQLPLPFSNEVESNLLAPNNDTIALSQALGIQVIAYSPLGYHFAKTLLTSADFLGQENPLLEVAESLNATPAQVALAWQINRGVAVIPKSTSSERLAQNLMAIEVAESLSEQPKLGHSLACLSTILPTVTDTAQDALLASEALSWQVVTPSLSATSSTLLSSSNQTSSVAREEENKADTTISVIP